MEQKRNITMVTIGHIDSGNIHTVSDAGGVPYFIPSGSLFHCVHSSYIFSFQENRLRQVT